MTPEGGSSPLCDTNLIASKRRRGTQRRFCDDRCRLIRWILKKVAKLLAPLEQSRGWEILLNLSKES
jgi:hypothetical protein